MLATTTLWLLGLGTLGSAQDPASPPTSPSAAAAATLTLPAFTGYAHPDPDRARRRDDGSLERCDGTLVFYVHLATAGELHLALRRDAAPGGELITAVGPTHAPPPAPIPGTFVPPSWPVPDPPRTTTTRLSSLKSPADAALGTFPIAAPGYHRIELRFADGAQLRELHSITLSGPAAIGARGNQKERRNAASVHLGYEVPTAHRDDVAWFYVEVTPRVDPLWTFYMATGWRRGYFGMQVNSPTERRVNFSVWDAGDEPTDRDRVAAADRVTLVAKGEDVVADRFGNEGTGGHSHLVHDWRLGDTFRFLVHAARDGAHTTYTGWFWFAAERRWGLVASFRAPKDGQLLRGLHSFSENFAGQNGDALRECRFGNVWVGTLGGAWFPLDAARFTHDATGARDRLDRCALVAGDQFVLRHGGFVAAPAGATTTMHERLLLPARATAAKRPDCLIELPSPPSAAPR
jgi:hypothetical protein